MGKLLIRVVFGRTVVADSIDREIAVSDRSGDTSNDTARSYLFDFSETRFVSITCCQYLIAFAMKCTLKGWGFLLILPLSKEVRDFWKLWNFFDALSLATSLPVESFVVEEQHALLKEPQSTFYERSTAVSHRREGGALRSRNFFGFHNINIDERTDGMSAVAEADQWRTKEIADIVERGLSMRSDYLASRVVFEAVFNAVKHPGANLIQTTSWHPQFYQRVGGAFDYNSPKPFSLVFWDNGRAFTSIMDKAIADGVVLRSQVDPALAMSYLVSYKGFEDKQEREVIHSDLEINADTSEPLKLLSSVFPGVSTSRTMDDLSAGSAHEISPRGMGLYILVYTVCILLHGKVSFRTGRNFLQLSKLGPIHSKRYQADLKAVISLIPPNVPTFYGNMLTVDLKSELPR